MMDLPGDTAIQPITSDCVAHAAQRFALPITLLHAILTVEGGHIGQKRANRNGSYDLGPMQINTLWLKTFAPYVSEQRILNNGCVNVLVGAWILRANINQAGDFWRGVGNYHSKTPDKHRRYQQKVYQASLVVE